LSFGQVGEKKIKIKTGHMSFCYHWKPHSEHEMKNCNKSHCWLSF